MFPSSDYTILCLFVYQHEYCCSHLVICIVATSILTSWYASMADIDCNIIQLAFKFSEKISSFWLLHGTLSSDLQSSWTRFMKHSLFETFWRIRSEWVEPSCLVSVASNLLFTYSKLQMETVRIHIQIINKHIKKSLISNAFHVFVVASGHHLLSGFSWILVTWA